MSKKRYCTIRLLPAKITVFVASPALYQFDESISRIYTALKTRCLWQRSHKVMRWQHFCQSCKKCIPWVKLGRIPPDLRSGTSYLRSTTSNLGSATAKWRSSSLMLGFTAIKLNVKSVGSRHKADLYESTNVNKQKLLNNRCARDECSA